VPEEGVAWTAFYLDASPWRPSITIGEADGDIEENGAGGGALSAAGVAGRCRCNRADDSRGAAGRKVALSLAFALLLPLPAYFRARLSTGSPRLASFSFHALRVGFVFGVLVGAERLFFPQLSGRIHKAHEYLALVAFAGAFLGVVGFWIALTQSW